MEDLKELAARAAGLFGVKIPEEKLEAIAAAAASASNPTGYAFRSGKHFGMDALRNARIHAEGRSFRARKERREAATAAEAAAEAALAAIAEEAAAEAERLLPKFRPASRRAVAAAVAYYGCDLAAEELGELLGLTPVAASRLARRGWEALAARWPDLSVRLRAVKDPEHARRRAAEIAAAKAADTEADTGTDTDADTDAYSAFSDKAEYFLRRLPQLPGEAGRVLEDAVNVVELLADSGGQGQAAFAVWFFAGNVSREEAARVWGGSEAAAYSQAATGMLHIRAVAPDVEKALRRLRRRANARD